MAVESGFAPSPREAREIESVETVWLRFRHETGRAAAEIDGGDSRAGAEAVAGAVAGHVELADLELVFTVMGCFCDPFLL